MNDLWRVDSSGQFTWIGGSKKVNGSFDFGQKGVAKSTNLPRPREFAAVATQGGIAWMFGGLVDEDCSTFESRTCDPRVNWSNFEFIITVQMWLMTFGNTMETVGLGSRVPTNLVI